MNDQQLGAFLRDRRKGLVLTEKQVAQRAGVSAKYISDLERGQRGLNERMLWALAAVLGLDVMALHALAGRLPSGCVPQTYGKALEASAAWRQIAKCGPRNPCQKAHVSLVLDDQEGV